MDYVEIYKKERPRIVAFTDRVKHLLSDIGTIHNIDVHAIEARAKSVDSFSEKIRRPGKTYENPLSEITDLCGLRVILYYQEDVEKFCNAIRAEFSVDESESIDKKKELNSDQFGYISVHLISTLSKERSKLIEWRQYEDLVVEIQVRTVLQHAWASISHAIQYKNEAETPSQFVRQLTRVAGLLELSDEQFSDLRRQSIALSKEIEKDIEVNNLGVEINNLSLNQYLASSGPPKVIVQIAAKSGLKVTEEFGYSGQLLMICYEMSIKTLDVLEEHLLHFLKFADKFFDLFVANSKMAEDPNYEISGGRDHWCAVAIVASQFDSDLSAIEYEQIWSTDYLSNVKLSASQASSTDKQKK